MMETPLSVPLVRSVPQRSQSNSHCQSRTLQSIAARKCDVVHKKGERDESRSIRHDWQVRYSPSGLPHRCGDRPTACFCRCRSPNEPLLRHAGNRSPALTRSVEVTKVTFGFVKVFGSAVMSDLSPNAHQSGIMAQTPQGPPFARAKSSAWMIQDTSAKTNRPAKLKRNVPLLGRLPLRRDT
jgi:hypothetical protein